MTDWLSAIAAASELSPEAARDLDEHGFVVLPGPVAPGQVERLAGAYDAAVASAAEEDVKIGSRDRLLRAHAARNARATRAARTVRARALSRCGKAINQQSPQLASPSIFPL